MGQASAPSCTVVIADDESALDFKIIYLDNWTSGDVRTAMNGAQALNLINQSEPDVLITDIQMPVMDGVELTRRIRADHKHANLRIIILSGNEDAVKTALEAGADRGLIKPVDAEELQAAILEVLADEPPTSKIQDPALG